MVFVSQRLQGKRIYRTSGCMWSVWIHIFSTASPVLFALTILYMNVYWSQYHKAIWRGFTPHGSNVTWQWAVSLLLMYESKKYKVLFLKSSASLNPLKSHTLRCSETSHTNTRAHELYFSRYKADDQRPMQLGFLTLTRENNRKNRISKQWFAFFLIVGGMCKGVGGKMHVVILF
jgi:hypothetical protein